jgi:predicted membrane protein
LKAQKVQFGERGGTKINLLLTLLILGSMIFAAVMLIPPYFTKYQLQDAMNTEARFASYNRKTDEEIREDVWKKIQELGVPAKRADIHITNENNNTQIDVNYTVPINMLFKTYDWDFHAHGDNHSL